MTPFIKLIHILAKVLEWLGNSFAALGMYLAGRASALREKVIEKLQIRREKLKRDGKVISYQLFVSHDAGLTYQCELKDKSLKKIVSRGRHLDGHMLRWYIMDKAGQYVDIACKIHGSIVATVENDMGQKIMARMARKDMEESE